jgi:hypothetical protein
MPLGSSLSVIGQPLMVRRRASGQDSVAATSREFQTETVPARGCRCLLEGTKMYMLAMGSSCSGEKPRPRPE